MRKEEISRALEELKQLEFVERIKLALEDPWYFMTGYPLGDRWTPGESKGFCYTLDEHDQKVPVKRFPNKEYLWHLVYEWVKNDKVVTAKSRQLTVSWTFIALHVWQWLNRTGQLSFFQNKKEADSMEMVRRGKIIYHHLPAEMKQLRPLKMPESAKEMEIDPRSGRHSRIRAIPQGADVLRQNTASAIFSDETAFQEEAEGSFTAAKPTISGGGRYTMVSSANGENFFYGIWSDHKGPAEQLMKGVRAWNNENGFRAIEVHYSADPDKDPATEKGKAWVEEERKGYTSEGWDREMEINFKVGSGRKMFADFSRVVHCRGLKYDSNKPLYIGWDWGFIHPAAIWAQINTRDQLCVLREFQGDQITAEQFAAEILRITRSEYKSAKVSHYCDPAGKKRSDVNAISTMELIRRTFHIAFRSARVGVPTRLEWVRKLLLKRTDGEPGILIDDSKCPTLVGGFEGGYVASSANPELPAEDDIYEHTQDTLQYILANIFRKLGLLNRLDSGEEKKLEQGRVKNGVWQNRNPFTGY